MLRFLLIAMVALGLFFRFTNLDQKLLDGDEGITAVRSAGYDVAMVETISRNQPIAPAEIEVFRQIKPGSSLVNTLQVNAAGAPQHTPLYFLLNRFWMQWFGSSAIALRSLTALFSALALPAMYWLCLELFNSPAVATLSVAMLAVSPTQLIHAQNARPRTLWILMILLSSAALLRAIRLNRKRDWSLYGLTLILHLYSFLFSILVVISHGIYVLLRGHAEQRKVFRPYLFTTLLALIAFGPWLAVVAKNFAMAKTMTAWTDYAPPLLDLLGGWAQNLCNLFFYWHQSYEAQLGIGERGFTIAVGLACLALVVYAFAFVCRHAPRQAWLLVLLLPGVTAAALVGPDLLQGGLRSSLSRYLFPCLLGVQLAIAYLFATKTTVAASTTHPKFWRMATVALLSLGVLSCGVMSPGQSWKGTGDFVIQSAELINQAPRPLVVSDDGIVFGLMPLNSRLESHVRWWLTDDPEAISLPPGFSDVFLFYPSEALLSTMQARADLAITPAYQHNYLNVFLWASDEPETLWRLEARDD